MITFAYVSIRNIGPQKSIFSRPISSSRKISKMASKVKSDAFKVMSVSKRMPLKKVLEEHKVKFVKGKAYYEMTKGEVIQDYKKVVVMRKKDEKFQVI